MNSEKQYKNAQDSSLCIPCHFLKMGKSSDVTPEKVAVIKALSKNGFKQIDIAEQVGCSQATVSKCVKKRQQVGELWPETINHNLR